MPAFFHVGMFILLGATLAHFFCVAVFGQLSRFVGWILVAVYGVFLWKGLPG
jgi:Ca2+/Na+ antiporter